MVRSLGMSPNATTSAGAIARAAHSAARVPALVTPGALTSSSPDPPEWVISAAPRTTGPATASIRSTSTSAHQASSLVIGPADQRSASTGTGISAPASAVNRRVNAGSQSTAWPVSIANPMPGSAPARAPATARATGNGSSRAARMVRLATSYTIAPLPHTAVATSPESSPSPSTYRGGRAVTNTISAPAAVARRSARRVRSETVPSVRTSVPSRSVAIMRGTGIARRYCTEILDADTLSRRGTSVQDLGWAGLPGGARRGGALPADQLGGDPFHPAPVAGRVERDRHRPRAHLHQRQPYRRQGRRDVARDRHVVEADHGDVVRDREAPGAQRGQRADRHRVVERDDRGQAGVGVEQPGGGGRAAVTVEVGVRHPAGRQRTAVFAGGAAQSGEPVGGGGQHGRPGDHADPAVPEPEDLGAEQVAARLVLRLDRVAGQLVAADDGQPAAGAQVGLQLAGQGAGERLVVVAGAGQDHRGHLVGPQQLDVLQLPVGVAVAVADDDQPALGG